MCLLRPASAQETLRGVALVIGNGDYEHLAPLANPPDDADAIEELLSDLGFDSVRRTDRDADDLARDLERFVEDAEEADVAVLYYAGHGIEAGGENWLVPVDADISALDSAATKLVPVSDVIRRLRETVAVTIVLLDACRDNPFPEGATLKVAANADAQPVSAGGLAVADTRGAAALAKPDATPSDNLGIVIGFAAAPGQVALDGSAGENSPYAAALTRHISAMAGEEFGTVMRMVAEEVYLKTGGRQRPWVNESLRRLLYFGEAPQPVEGAEGDILTERRQLLLSIAALPDVRRSQAQTLSRTGGVPMSVVFAMMRALDLAPDADPATVEQRLTEEIERFAARRADRDPLANPDEEIQRLTRLADEAELEGAFNAANSFRDQAKARVASLRSTRQTQIEQLRQRIIEDAEVYARSAETKTLIFRHAEAARDYAEARDIVAEWDAEKAIEYARNQIDALLTDAELRGASGSLGEAERTARALLETDMGPGDRATFGLRLARALSLSASGTGDSALFVEAAGRLETALGEAGNSDPSLRAGILLTLGLARGQLAFLSGDLTALADAESRFDAAAEEARAAGDHALQAEAEFRAVQAMYYRWTDSPDVELFGRIQQRFLKLMDRIDDQDIDPQAARYLSRVSEIGFDLAMRQNTPDALRQAAEMNDAVAGMFDADRYPIVAAQLRSLDALIGMRLAQRFGDTAQLESALNNVDAALATFSEAELPAPTRDTRWQKILLLITMGTRENETVHLESARQEIAILQAGFPDMTAEQVRLIEFQSARIDAAIAVREGDTELLESAVGELSRIHGSIDRTTELPIYTEVGEELGKARSWLFGLTGEGIEQTVATLRETVEQYEAWGGAAASAVPFAELSQYYATATANYAMETGAAADIEAAVEANIAIRDQLAALGDGIGAANAANTAAYMLVQSLRKDFDADTFRRARALSDEALAKLDAAPQFAGYFNNTACELDTEKARADDDADLARAALAQCRAALATLEANGQSDAIPTARASVARAERLIEGIGG